jgi:hypothetical protein
MVRTWKITMPHISTHIASPSAISATRVETHMHLEFEIWIKNHTKRNEPTLDIRYVSKHVYFLKSKSNIRGIGSPADILNLESWVEHLC